MILSPTRKVRLRASALVALACCVLPAAHAACVGSQTGDLAELEELLHERAFGPWAYALGGKGKPELLKRLRDGVVASCESLALRTSDKRALRWGGRSLAVSGSRFAPRCKAGCAFSRNWRARVATCFATGPRSRGMIGR